MVEQLCWASQLSLLFHIYPGCFPASLVFDRFIRNTHLHVEISTSHKLQCCHQRTSSTFCHADLRLPCSNVSYCVSGISCFSDVERGEHERICKNARHKKLDIRTQTNQTFSSTITSLSKLKGIDHSCELLPWPTLWLFSVDPDLQLTFNSKTGTSSATVDLKLRRSCHLPW